MGALDDAIREHLELKRRLGASEEELKVKEDEAFGHGKPLTPPEPAADLEAIEAGPAPEAQALVEDAPPETVEHEPAPPAQEPVVEEFEPDEVLPEESLETEAALEPPPAQPSSANDVLEKTPEFLEETSDQDSLWFEQKPPKDFDFDD